MMKKSEKAPGKSTFLEYAEALIVAVFLALVIRTFIVEPFTIPSGSMEKTLLVGDYMLVNKFWYGLKIPFTEKYLVEGEDPQLGDVIVFPYPEDPSVDFVKRIVGRPGDVVEMRNKRFYRNGEPVSEPYIQNILPNTIGPLDNMPPFTVPEGQYFVMGDNRDNSKDSRDWGTVRRGAIEGKAWRIHWSWDKTATAVRWDRLGMKIE